MLRSCLLASLALLSPALTPAQDPLPGAEEVFQLEVSEEFRTTGDEPSYWASFSRSEAARTEVTAGLFEFTFQLLEIEAVLGSSEIVRFLPTSGVSRLRITQDSASQQLDLPKGGVLTGYLNGCLDGLAPMGATFVTQARLFDGSVVPGAQETTTQLSCTSEVMAVGGLVYTLLEFSSTPVQYQVRDSQVQSQFRGVAMIDRERGQVLHMGFQQNGSVRTADRLSNFDQLTRTTLVNNLGQPVLPISASMEKRMEVFFFRSSLDIENLDPDILDDNPRPDWAIPTWLAGRMAEASLGLVAEQGTNPIPVTSLGGLVLTDQTLGFAGNILFDATLVDLGQRDSSESDATDWEVRSPLERALGDLDAAPRQSDDKLILFGPETKGSAQIGEELIPLGITFEAASQLMDNAGPSNLSFASGAGTQAFAAGGSAAIASTGAGAWFGLLGAIGTVGVGTVIAEGDKDESDASSPATLVYDEITNGSGCSEGTLTLRVEGGDPGVMWSMVGLGTFTQECLAGDGTAWSESGMGITNGAGFVEFSIPVTPFRDCLDASLDISRNGQPARFNYSWPDEGISGFAVGSISNDCL